MSMSGTPVVHITSLLGLLGFLVLWIMLFECAHILVALLRHDQLIGWAISPLGVTTLFLREPSLLYILLDTFFPAAVSGSALYIGLFTSLTSPLAISRYPWLEIVVIAAGILITSTKDFLNMFRDLRYPLWGEARILRSILYLRPGWARIHFTPFGLSYLHDHFNFTPADMLQAF
jgi:hypothetical protein